MKVTTETCRTHYIRYINFINIHVCKTLGQMSYWLYDVPIVFESDVIRKSKIGLINKCIYFCLVYVGYFVFFKGKCFLKERHQAHDLVSTFSFYNVIINCFKYQRKAISCVISPFHAISLLYIYLIFFFLLTEYLSLTAFHVYLFKWSRSTIV